MSVIKKSLYWIAGIILSLILVVFISYQYQERQTKKAVEKIDAIFSKPSSFMKHETFEEARRKSR